jgi:CNT family concentrative nucleoside transporter
MQERLLSVVGALVMMALAFGLCPASHRRRVNPRTIIIGVVLLVAVAVLVLRTPVRRLFSLANTAIERMLGYGHEGALFVFGKLADERAFGFVFAVQVLPTILFFSAVMAILYHYGVMPFVIERLGRALSRSLGVSGAESFSTVADVFVGQTEAPLAVRPYLAKLTLSELNACMVAGFATTAGGVLAAYVVMLQAAIPGIAGHLIACSVMSAPASLVIAKLMLPEVETPETTGELRATTPRTTANVLDAVAVGATDGLKLAVNVAAMLLVFLALTAFANALLGWVGAELLGVPLSLERVLGWVFSPLAFFLGVPASDVTKVGSLLGQKTVLNEFVAYSHLREMLERDPAWLSERSRVIASYALCGFANFGSIGIQIGGYSSLAPARRADLARLAFRAMIGGLLATNLVACVAGALV